MLFRTTTVKNAPIKINAVVRGEVWVNGEDWNKNLKFPSKFPGLGKKQ